MNRLISWFQSIQLRQVMTVFLIMLTFLVSTSLVEARAESVTPEANSYQINASGVENVKQKTQDAAKQLVDSTKQATKDAKENTQAAGNSFFDNIREKLNLDEPIDPGTKQAVKQLEEAASEVVKIP